MKPTEHLKLKKWILDVHSSINNIEQFTVEIKCFDDFESQLLIQRAVERELEIIGEAMNRILKVKPNIEISNARKMVDLRNKVIHDYDGVDTAMVYSILKTHIPILKNQTIEIMSKWNLL